MDKVPATRWPPGSTLVVLTGGASRRLGRDKATVHVGGRRLVDRLLRAVPAEVPVVLAGPRPDGLELRVQVVREEPPGSGPLAGLAAGLAHVRTELVGVIAADMPFGLPVVAAALTRLAAGSSGADPGAVVPVDPMGFPQLLCAGYRTHSLRAALADLGPVDGLPVRALLPRLEVRDLHVPAAALADVDNVDQLAAARARAAQEEGADMQAWVDAVRAALGVDVAVDVDAILDLAGDAAQDVARPAALVTTYLLGAAVAGEADPAQAAARIGELARCWGQPDQ